jgi:hypothetical protein
MNKRLFLLLVVFLLLGCSQNPRAVKISTNSSGTFGAVRWSPGGKQILATFYPYENDESTKLMIYSTDTGEWKQIKELGKKSSVNIDWLNDQTIVYEIGSVESVDPLKFFSQVFFLDIVTGVESLADQGESVIDLCVNNVDQQLVLVSRLPTLDESFGITILDIKTNTRTILYAPQTGESVTEVACSSDGQNIAFVLAKKNSGTSNRVHVFSLNILNLSDIETTTPIGFSDLTIDSISWTKDGYILARVIDNLYQRIAVLVSPDGEQTPMNLQSIDPVIIDPSPTENKMAVTSLGTPGFNSVFIIQNDLFINE